MSHSIAYSGGQTRSRSSCSVRRMSSWRSLKAKSKLANLKGEMVFRLRDAIEHCPARKIKPDGEVSAETLSIQNFGVMDVYRVSIRESVDLIKSDPEVSFKRASRDVAEMRRANRVLHAQ